MKDKNAIKLVKQDFASLFEEKINIRNLSKAFAIASVLFCAIFGNSGIEFNAVKNAVISECIDREATKLKTWLINLTNCRDYTETIVVDNDKSITDLVLSETEITEGAD